MPLELPLEALETLLAWAFGVGAVLFSSLIALVVYVFLSLKAQVEKVSNGVDELNNGRWKLVHRDDCRAAVGRVHQRLDEQDAAQHELSERLSRVETLVGAEI